MSITKLIRIPSKVPASIIKEAVESYQKTLREDVNPYLKEDVIKVGDNVVGIQGVDGGYSGKVKSIKKDSRGKTLVTFVDEKGKERETFDFNVSKNVVGYKKMNEAKEEKLPLITKGIYTQDGKKVEGARSSKLSLGAVDKHGIVTDLTWKEWVALKVPDTSSAGTKKEFLNRLAKPIKQMAKKIELNTFLKDLPSFEDAVNYIMKLDSSVKYSKSGLKESTINEGIWELESRYNFDGKFYRDEIENTDMDYLIFYVKQLITSNGWGWNLPLDKELGADIMDIVKKKNKPSVVWAKHNKDNKLATTTGFDHETSAFVSLLVNFKDKMFHFHAGSVGEVKFNNLLIKKNIPLSQVWDDYVDFTTKNNKDWDDAQRKRDAEIEKARLDADADAHDSYSGGSQNRVRRNIYLPTNHPEYRG